MLSNIIFIFVLNKQAGRERFLDTNDQFFLQLRILIHVVKSTKQEVFAHERWLELPQKLSLAVKKV